MYVILLNVSLFKIINKFMLILISLSYSNYDQNHTFIFLTCINSITYFFKIEIFIHIPHKLDILIMYKYYYALFIQFPKTIKINY